MGFYGDQILPRLLNLVMARDTAEVRTRVAAGLTGAVLEIGFGSGLNVPYYPPGVTRVWAVDPATVGRKLAAGRVRASPVPVEYAGLTAEAIPLADAGADHVLSTWNLCTIPDPARALAEVKRILRPGGQLHFVEHGRSPDLKVARMQDRIEPIQKRFFGGCHVTRRIDQLIEASGLELTELKNYYRPGTAFDGYTYEGIATKSA